ADHGDPNGLLRLAEMREKAGDRESAETLARQAADQGFTEVLVILTWMRVSAGDREGAEIVARQAADHGGTDGRRSSVATLKRLWPYGLDPDGTPTPAWQ
ncbi:hypothetical protein ACSNOJ_26610, partial [Streptomyces sp. URMC 128]